MRFRCPFCFLAVDTLPESCGYPIECPNCHHRVTVPAGRFQSGCIIGDFLIKEKIGEGANAMHYLYTVTDEVSSYALNGQKKVRQLMEISYQSYEKGDMRYFERHENADIRG